MFGFRTGSKWDLYSWKVKWPEGPELHDDDSFCSYRMLSSLSLFIHPKKYSANCVHLLGIFLQC